MKTKIKSTDKVLEEFAKNTEKLTLKWAIISIVKHLEVKDRQEILKEIIDMYQSELDVFGESK